MTEETEDPENFGPTLLVKIPFFLLGVALGMVIVWVAFQWVPVTMSQAMTAIR